MEPLVVVVSNKEHTEGKVNPKIFSVDVFLFGECFLFFML